MLYGFWLPGKIRKSIWTIFRMREEDCIAKETNLHTPGLYMGAMASGNSLFLLGLAAENTAQKHQLFGWETDSGFYLGRLSQAVGLN